jgi:hypothetical protein
MSLSIEVAVSNLAVLKTFAVGEKPVYNKETGEISKENREYLVWIRRWWTAAFNKEILSTTFRVTLPFLKVTEIKLCPENNTKFIEKDFQPALEGVKNIIQTYRNENKDKTAGKIQKIYDKYVREYSEVVATSSCHNSFPPTPPVFEKKNSTRTTLEAIHDTAEAHSKVVLAQYQQDLHARRALICAELKERVADQLKKVEAKTKLEVKEDIPAIFNTSIIEKIPQAPVLDLETDDKEWQVDKPSLLRTQSMRIERPVTPKRDYSRPKFIPHNTKSNLGQFDMTELNAEIIKRREKMKKE